MIGDPSALSTLDAYSPLPTSPVIAAGIDTTSFELPPAEHDFSGVELPDGEPPIGAITLDSS